MIRSGRAELRSATPGEAGRVPVVLIHGMLGNPDLRTGMTERVYQDAAIAAERDALVPVGRVATPEDMADAIGFLLSADARYINGHDLVVDGAVSGNFLGRLPGLKQIPRG